MKVCEVQPKDLLKNLQTWVCVHGDESLRRGALHYWWDNIRHPVAHGDHLWHQTSPLLSVPQTPEMTDKHTVGYLQGWKIHIEAGCLGCLIVLTQCWVAAVRQWCSELCRRGEKKPQPAGEMTQPWTPLISDNPTRTESLGTKTQQSF